MKTLGHVVTAALVIALPHAAQADQPLKCASAGYTATYSPESKGIAPQVDVRFQGPKPTSAVAEAALRKCLQEAADTMFINSEVLATAWYGPGNDAEPLSLTDGSDNLVWDPKTKRIRTFNERLGIKPATVSEAPGVFVEYKEQQTWVKPIKTFATVSVVFEKQPTEKVAYETAIAELTKAVQRTHGAMDTTTYIYVGKRDDPASRAQVRGSNGKFIGAEYDAESPGRVMNLVGDDLPAKITITK